MPNIFRYIVSEGSDDLDNASMAVLDISSCEEIYEKVKHHYEKEFPLAQQRYNKSSEYYIGQFDKFFNSPCKLDGKCGKCYYLTTYPEFTNDKPDTLHPTAKYLHDAYGDVHEIFYNRTNPKCYQELGWNDMVLYGVLIPVYHFVFDPFLKMFVKIASKVKRRNAVVDIEAARTDGSGFQSPTTSLISLSQLPDQSKLATSFRIEDERDKVEPSDDEHSSGRSSSGGSGSSSSSEDLLGEKLIPLCDILKKRM